MLRAAPPWFMGNLSGLCRTTPRKRSPLKIEMKLDPYPSFFVFMTGQDTVLAPGLARFQRKSSFPLRLLSRLLDQDRTASFSHSNEDSSQTIPGLGRPVVLLIVGGEHDSIPSSLGSLWLTKLTENGY